MISYHAIKDDSDNHVDRLLCKIHLLLNEAQEAVAKNLKSSSSVDSLMSEESSQSSVFHSSTNDPFIKDNNNSNTIHNNANLSINPRENQDIITLEWLKEAICLLFQLFYSLLLLSFMIFMVWQLFLLEKLIVASVYTCQIFLLKPLSWVFNFIFTLFFYKKSSGV